MTVWDFDAGEPTELGAIAGPCYEVRWTAPESFSIVSRDDRSKLAIVRVAGTPESKVLPHTVAAGSYPGYDVGDGPVWSPSGLRLVLFPVPNTDQRPPVLLDVRRESPEALPLKSRDGLLATRPCAFSPDEAWLVCKARHPEHTPRAGVLRTIAFDLRSSGAEKLLSVEGNDVDAAQMSWLTPDWLVLYGTFPGAPVWLESPDTGNTAVLHPPIPTRTRGFFAAAPTGAAGAYFGDCDGKTGVCVDRVDAAGTVSSTFLVPGSPLQPIWSTNGKHLLVIDSTTQKSRVQLIRNLFGPGRTMDPLGPEEAGMSYSARFSPQSDWVVVHRRPIGGKALPRAHLVAWHVPSLTAHDLSSGEFATGWVRFSDDDRMLASTSASRDGSKDVLTVRLLNGATIEQPFVVAEGRANHTDYGWQPGTSLPRRVSDRVRSSHPAASRSQRPPS